jgi:type I restriction enzyme S subunit
MGEWSRMRLDEVTLMITDGAHHSPTEYKNGYPMFSVKDMGEQGFICNNTKTISEDDYVKLIASGCQPKVDDILIAKDGSVLKHIFRVKDKPNYVLLSSIAIIRPKSSLVDPAFLVYAFKEPSTKDLILSNFVGGSGVPRIILKDFKKIEFNIPNLKTQRAIAEVLSSLDDKIDLLHRQNRTLEQMAETLFRQWFVEEAKEDWEVKTFYDSIKLVGGGTPKTSIDEYWNGEIKWLSGGDIASNHKSVVTTTERNISELGLLNSSAKLLPKYSTVISARGTVGKYCILSEPMAFSQSNYGILPVIEGCEFFTYLLVNYAVEELKSGAYGSVFDTITTDTFKNIKYGMPSTEEILEIEHIIRPMFIKVLNNSLQLNTIEKLRDTLLPKLMSGEVRVKI